VYIFRSLARTPTLKHKKSDLAGNSIRNSEVREKNNNNKCNEGIYILLLLLLLLLMIRTAASYSTIAFYLRVCKYKYINICLTASWLSIAKRAQTDSFV
jgi:hypothetical protein